MAAFSFDSIIDSVLNIDDTDPSRSVSIQVLVDESTDPKLVEQARALLVPATENVKLSVSSFFDNMATIEPSADLVVIIANESAWVGATAAVAGAAEVACVVLAQNLAIAVKNAETTGFPLDYENVICPEVLSQEKIPFGDAVDYALDMCASVAGGAFDVVTKAIPRLVIGEPLTEATLGNDLPRFGTREVAYSELFDALGAWVVANCSEFKDAFARAFDFAKLPQIRQIAQRTANENALTGAMFFSKQADFPIMTLNQVKMLIQISRAYGITPDKQTIPEVVLVVSAAFASRTIVRLMCRSFPLLSWFIKIGMSWLVTMAMGHVLNMYLQSGRVFPVEKIGKFELNTDQLPSGRTVVAHVG